MKYERWRHEEQWLKKLYCLSFFNICLQLQIVQNPDVVDRENGHFEFEFLAEQSIANLTYNATEIKHFPNWEREKSRFLGKKYDFQKNL